MPTTLNDGADLGIAATASHLRLLIDTVPALVHSAQPFRMDLLYRLNVFPIHVPPLRERRADIPLLITYFAARHARRAGKAITSIDGKSLELLSAYDWPGNIRELQNVIERSVILCEDGVLSVDEAWLRREASPSPRLTVHLMSSLADHEREMIEAALASCQVPPGRREHRAHRRRACARGPAGPPWSVPAWHGYWNDPPSCWEATPSSLQQTAQVEKRRAP